MPTPEILWYVIPREGAFPWEPEGRRPVDLAYLQQLGVAADRLGYDGALFATDLYDVWPLASALAAVTRPSFKPLLAVHPGLVSPTLLAKMALTFSQLFGPDRLRFNVVNGSTEQLRQSGLHLEHDERYELSAEYWSIVKRLTAGEVFDHKGRFYDLPNAGAALRELAPVQGGAHTPLWFGGSSAPGIELAAEHVDVYLTWGEPLDQLRQKLDQVRARAAAHGRTLRLGLRLHLIVRDTEEQAWAAADRLLDVTSQATYARMLGDGAEDGVGWQRQFRQHGGRVPARARELETHPNLWPGMSLFRPGPGTAVVGSTQQVIERLQEYRELGVDTFILSGNPLLEEAYRVAETVLPALRQA
ncbi:LLM class flavin-dependent oxidoreductase [Kitasatospora sp. NPDC101801]|uniref:LLM class flavin-dependent oxidoreductase n=1 Tax=Kitasatospora sp. NPDC101801 TaxID=3364103 RepID=UPI003823AEA1